jgi:V8-like Glu-specific endopeptidase
MSASRRARGPGRARLLAQRLALAVLAVVAAVTGVLVSAPARTDAEARTMVAVYGQMSPIGALFAVTPTGRLGSHFCTGSVVDSASGDLVLTAAHCVQGHPASQMAFIPDYYAGRWPDGVWRVTRVIVDSNWMKSQDPDDDFAFLTVTRPGSRVSLQSLTGSEGVAVDVPAGQRVEVAGYPDGAGDLISCQNTAGQFTATQYQFACTGFSDGTSGSPLLADIGPDYGLDTVIGVIGGYEQGGTTSSVSYAARFGGQLGALYQEALQAEALSRRAMAAGRR